MTRAPWANRVARRDDYGFVREVSLTLWEVINSTREKYLDGLRNTLRQQRERMADLKAEPLVAVGPGQGAADVPEDYRVFRVDFLWVQEGEPKVGAFDGGAVAVGGPCAVRYPDGQEVRVAALRWDDCEFRCAPAAAIDDPLRAWLRHWQDRAGANLPDADGLSSAVHSATPPGTSPDGSMVGFAVDFGSAPPEAFTALIAALLASGVQFIQVGMPQA